MCSTGQPSSGGCPPPKAFRIPLGGVRTFLPGVQLTDLNDHLRHPMLSARSMDESRTGRMIRARVGRKLMPALHTTALNLALPDALLHVDALLDEEEADLPASPVAPRVSKATGVYRTESATAARSPAPDPTDAERERTLALAAELKRRNARLAELERDYEQLRSELRETVRERNQYREQLRKARYENTWLRDQPATSATTRRLPPTLRSAERSPARGLRRTVGADDR